MSALEDFARSKGYSIRVDCGPRGDLEPIREFVLTSAHIAELASDQQTVAQLQARVAELEEIAAGAEEVMALIDDFGTAARIGTAEDEAAKRKAVRATIGRLMTDAEFYRWLRDENDWHAEPRLDAADGTVWKLVMYSPQEIMDPTDDDSLDAAIRAAIAAQVAKGGGKA